MGEILDRIGDYTIREQSHAEIHGGQQIPFDLCGVNPYDHYRAVRRFIAELNGREVGEGWTMASRHQPWGYLGHYGMFAEEHKRKGLGGRLLELCIEAMQNAGMQVMFIDTGPSIAHSVYEKHGFVDAVPDHPEWLGQAFDGSSLNAYLDDYFTLGNEAQLEARPLDLGHLIEIQALLNGGVGQEALVKNYLLTLFHDDQLHQGQILIEMPDLSKTRSGSKGVHMRGLFAGSKLIGFSTIAPWRQSQWNNGHEAHIGLVDIYLHPRAWRPDWCRSLFAEIKELAIEMGFGALRTLETPHQSAKTEALADLGFEMSYQMPDQVLLGEGKPERGAYPSHRLASLAVYEMQLGQPAGFTHPYRRPWDY